MHWLGFSLIVLMITDTGQPKKQKEFGAVIQAAQNSVITLGTTFNKLTATGVPDNVACSPVSLLLALILLSFGTDGDSTKQIRELLELRVDEEEIKSGVESLLGQLETNDDILVMVSTGLYVKEQALLKDEFAEVAMSEFQADVQNIDFKEPESINKINNWIEEASNDKIKNLLEKLNPNTLAMLLNVGYFKGIWKAPFDPRHTYLEVFHCVDGFNTSIEFMHITSNFIVQNNEEMNAKLIFLPYKRSVFNFVIVLPEETSNLEETEKKFYQKFKRHMKISKRNNKKTYVDLAVPKFKISSSHRDIIPALKELGITNIFNISTADFSRLTDTKMIIDDIYQEAVINVDEFGTEMAAFTVLIGPTSTGLRPLEINVNHPFLFAIVHTETMVPFFAGRVTTFLDTIQHVEKKHKKNKKNHSKHKY